MHQTYRYLAQATVGSREIVTPSYRAHVGRFNHPICNLAVGFDLTVESVRELAELANSHPSLQIYFTDEDRPLYGIEMLQRAGFEVGYQLSIMTCLGRESGRGDATAMADSIGERHIVAKFMADQFFPKLSRSIRGQLVGSTALAADLELHRSTANPISAACMLYEDADTVGIYNLCVRSGERGNGVGSAIVRQVLDRGHRRGKVVTLQCHSEIEAWYGRFGFERIGFVSVLGVSC